VPQVAEITRGPRLAVAASSVPSKYIILIGGVGHQSLRESFHFS